MKKYGRKSDDNKSRKQKSRIKRALKMRNIKTNLLLFDKINAIVSINKVVNKVAGLVSHSI